MIASAAIGLLLSTGLQGCANSPPPAAPTAVAVAVRSDPPADLLACARHSAPLPEDQAATVAPALRSALIALAQAFAINAAQLDRLIEWEKPGACSAAGK